MKKGNFSYQIDNYHSMDITWREQKFSLDESDGNYYSELWIWPTLQVKYGSQFTSGASSSSFITITAYEADGETVWSTVTQESTTNWGAFSLAEGASKNLTGIPSDVVVLRLNRGDGTGQYVVPLTFTVNAVPASGDAIYDIHSGESVELTRILTSEEQPYINARSNGWTQVQNPSVGYVVPAPDRIETLKLLVGFSEDQIIATRDIPIQNSNKYTIEFTADEQAALIGGIPTETSGTVYFYLVFTSDGIEYKTLGMPSTFRIYGGYPQWYADSDVSDINETTLAVTGNNKIFIRYESDAQFFLYAHGNDGAWVSEYVVSSNLQSARTTVGYGSEGGVALTIEGIDSWPCAVTVTDSRGLTNSYSEFKSDYLFIEYIKPTCNLETSVSAQGEITATVSGAVFTDYFDALPGETGTISNPVTVEYRYRLKSNPYFSVWTVMPFSELDEDNYIFDNAYSVKATISGLDYKEAYIFEARITDRLHTVESGSKQALAMTVFDWSKDDFNFNVPVNINGNLYQYNNLVAIPGLGTWTPQCNACTNPTVSYGNYVLMGDMCLINFYFQGTIDVDPSLTEWKLYFYGLPYTPHTDYRWQAGGGNCQGYAVPTVGNQEWPDTPPTGDKKYHRFTGWSIEGGVIYGRTHQMTNVGQSTEYLSYDNGDTVYGFYKPEGSFYITAVPGQAFYASGTIMYKIDPDQGGVVG